MPADIWQRRLGADRATSAGTLRKAAKVSGSQMSHYFADKRSLTAELVESDAELRADFASGFERWETRLRQGLLAMQRRGDLSPDSDPDALAYSLLAAPLLMLAESNVASGRPTGG